MYSCVRLCISSVANVHVRVSFFLYAIGNTFEAEGDELSADLAGSTPHINKNDDAVVNAPLEPRLFALNGDGK